MNWFPNLFCEIITFHPDDTKEEIIEFFILYFSCFSFISIIELDTEKLGFLMLENREVNPKSVSYYLVSYSITSEEEDKLVLIILLILYFSNFLSCVFI